MMQQEKAAMTADRLLAHYETIADAPDAIARLRRFILDLAVRGKLVPQDPNDEPASELLKRIAKEKARLVKAGAIRTPKAIPAQSEAPFPIPSNWRWSQLAEIGVLSPRNEAPDTLEASFVPMPMIAAEYGVANQHEIRPWGEIKKGYTHFAEGDVGLAKITPCFENGKSAVFRNLTGGIGSGTTELHIVRPLFVDQDYILLFLKGPHFIETGIPKMTGTAGQKRVPTEYFAHSPFPLPPLAEQHRIVAKVDELMGLCDRLEAARAGREATRDRLAAASLARLNAPDPKVSPAKVGTGFARRAASDDESTFQDDARFVLDALPALTTRPDHIKRLRQTILNLAVRGKLVPQDPNDEPASELLKRIAKEIPLPKMESGKGEALPYVVPTNWVWTKLGWLVAHSDAGWSPKTEDFPRSGDEWGVLKVSAVSWDKFRAWENKQVLHGTEARLQAQVKQGDFLISRANTAELIARAVIVDEEPVKLMMSDKIVRLLLSKSCNHRFVWLVNNYADFARAHYVERASGVSPSMKNVSRDVILGLPIPLPPLAEQHRIVAKVDALMALCDRLEASITATAATRRRLLDALLTEALAPVDAHEPAAAE
jgi:type I restriction enzyme S subunit